MLRVAREESGRGVREWARQLGVKTAYLEALEDCRFDDLPEPVLAKGFLRRYAAALSLDPEPLLALYPSRPTFTPGDVISPPPRRRLGFLWWLLPLLLLLGLGGWWYAGRQAAAVERVEVTTPKPPAPPPPEATLTVKSEPAGAVVWLDGFRLGKAPVRGSFAPGERTLRVEADGYQPYQGKITLAPGADKSLRIKLTPLPEKEEKPAPKPATLTLRFTEKAWVRVSAPDGKKLYEGIPKIGSELSYPLPVLVHTGNAAGVHVIENGKDVGALGGEGLVVKRKFELPKKP